VEKIAKTKVKGKARLDKILDKMDVSSEKKVIQSKAVKKTKSAAKESTECNSEGSCGACSWVMPIIIIVLAWWKPAVMWSQIVITVAALLMIAGSNCSCKKS
jgi:hypothetical protein